MTPPQKTALICGVSGQDGAYLSDFLLKKGYKVHGASRDAQLTRFTNLQRLGIADQVELESITVSDFRSILEALHRIKPDEVYNLAGQSSVGLSFEQPAETIESNALGALNCLEAIRFTHAPIRFYNAGSGEAFGETGHSPADESTAFRPRSPYAIGKAAAFWTVANYREAYSMFACTGILFNHESPLRARRFVTRKIVGTACAIAAGEKIRLRLGNIGISRDWGWAPEYVKAMWLMLQADQPDDFIIGTGETNTLESFVEASFQAVGLDWHDHVDIDHALWRPTDIEHSRCNPEKARTQLGWQARFRMRDVVGMMVEAEREGANPRGL